MRGLLLLGHFLGMVLWLGAGAAAMQVGSVLRSGGAGREETALLLGIMMRLYRGLLLPGAVLTVATGLLLSLRLYSGAISAAGYPTSMMVMQGAGLVAAVIAVGVMFPAATRLTRLDPSGPHAEQFHRLRKRAGVSGMISGLLGLVALVAGAFLR